MLKASKHDRKFVINSNHIYIIFNCQCLLNSIICDIRHEARICSIIILTLFYNNTAAYSG